MTIGETLFNCKIQLSKKGGISISIKDLSQPDQVYKQIIIDNDSLVIKTNKQASSSTITQVEDKLTTQVTMVVVPASVVTWVVSLSST
jgi:hypothetical protein